jgi:N-acetylmuramic acid 6-phosphate etherase
VYGNLMVDVVATNSKLRQRAVRLVVQAARTDESSAAAALAATDGDVKAAIATLRLDVSPQEAAARLASAHGRLRTVLGEE